MRASFEETGVYKPDQLHAGDFPIRTKTVTLNSGQNLKRGALLGKITTGGNVTLSLSASSDGSEVPFAILAEDTDASAANAEAIVYLTGDFNTNAMTFGTGHTAESVFDACRDQGLHLVGSIEA